MLSLLLAALQQKTLDIDSPYCYRSITPTMPSSRRPERSLATKMRSPAAPEASALPCIRTSTPARPETRVTSCPRSIRIGMHQLAEPQRLTGTQRPFGLFADYVYLIDDDVIKIAANLHFFNCDVRRRDNLASGHGLDQHGDVGIGVHRAPARRLSRAWCHCTARQH